MREVQYEDTSQTDLQILHKTCFIC